MSFSDLEILLSLARAHGVRSISYGGVSVEFGTASAPHVLRRPEPEPDLAREEVRAYLSNLYAASGYEPTDADIEFELKARK